MQATPFGRLTLRDYGERMLREMLVLSLICLAIYLGLSLYSYAPADPGWSHVGEATGVANAGGRTGAWFADVAFYLVGYPVYLLPLMIAWTAWLIFRARDIDAGLGVWFLSLRWQGFVLVLIACCAYAAIHLPAWGGSLPNGPGGGLGALIGDWLRGSLNVAGANIVLAGSLLFGLSLLFGISLLHLLDALGSGALGVLDALGRLLGARTRRGPAVASGSYDLPDDIVLAPELEPTCATSPAERYSHFEMLVLRNAARRPSRGTLSAAVPSGLDLIDAETATSSTSSAKTVRPGVPQALLEQLDEPHAEPAMLVPPTAADDAASAAVESTPSAKAAKSAEDGRSGGVAALFGRLTGSAAERDSTPKPQSGDGRVLPLRRRGAVGASVALPPLDLLDPPSRSGQGYSAAQIDELSRQVERNLADFGVEVQVVHVAPGPVVTLFELELAPGIKASKITGLARDLARSLTTSSVRVVELIPGKSVIGLEIPNKQRQVVMLREIIDSPPYEDSGSPLTISLGTSISGRPLVADLARMPHALIAGTTGSGKSVAINAMILSLIYKSTPRDVRLIMVDPKMLELSVYEGIPHLLAPVVTDMKEAANALRWCVGEMERRYRLMAGVGVRNIGGFNRKVAEALAAGQPIVDPTLTPEQLAACGDEVPTLDHLPYIVVIIDELADMMMVVGKKVEELIMRLAQKARACGIHLLLATQRPSVDVLTGVIKANIPTRMAFQVSSRIDSRTILDQMGAEQLLGNGDMLYLPPGGNIPQRVHGAFVDDHEIHRVVAFLKSHSEGADYVCDVLREPTEAIPGLDPEPRGGDLEDSDPLFDDAVRIVIESRKGSISWVQRQLKVGYNRAARMIEEMERIGIVGPAESGGTREVLVPPPEGS